MCCRWILHYLIQKIKNSKGWPVPSCLERYQEGKVKTLYNIITVDETWVYCYNPLTNQQIYPMDVLMWNASYQSKTIAKLWQTNDCFLFWTYSIPLLFILAVTADSYITISLPTMLINSSEKQTVLDHDNTPAHFLSLKMPLNSMLKQCPSKLGLLWNGLKGCQSTWNVKRSTLKRYKNCSFIYICLVIILYPVWSSFIEVNGDHFEKLF